MKLLGEEVVEIAEDCYCEAKLIINKYDMKYDNSFKEHYIICPVCGRANAIPNSTVLKF